MTTTLILLILIRVMVDFVAAFRPRPLYDVIYAFVLFVAGIMLLQSSSPDRHGLWLGWFCFGVAVASGVRMILKTVGLRVKAQSESLSDAKHCPQEQGQRR
jgi:hypothetical protein